MNTSLNQSLAFTAHRLAPAMVGVLFAVSGYAKIGAFDAVSGGMASMGLPFASLLLIATIALEVGAGLMLIVGFKTRLAALALAAFLIPTTVIFHAFWSADPAQAQDQLTQFLKNLAIFGATLMIAAQPQAEAKDARTAPRLA